MKELAVFLAALSLAGCSSDGRFMGSLGTRVQSGFASASSESRANWTESEWAAGSPAQLARINRGTYLIGAEVKNLRDEKLGKLADLYIDLASGRIIYAVVATGAILGFGEKLVPVPPTAFFQHTDCRTLVLNEDRQTFAAAPSFDRSQTSKLFHSEALASVYRYHGIDPDRADSPRQTGPLEFNYGQKELTRRLIARHLALASHEDGPSSGAPAVLHKASEVIGTKVRNQDGQTFGEVRDLVVDLKSGHVTYAVVSAGVSGLSEKLIAVPPSALAQNGTSFSMQADHNKFIDATSFPNNRWSDLSNPTWGARVYRYHGREPYWQSGEAEAPPDPDHPGR